MTITRPTGPQVSALVDIERLMTGRTDAVVIGAGVIGLTTAIRLAESGATTRIVTVDDPAETTSVLATAMVGPTFGLFGPRATPRGRPRPFRVMPRESTGAAGVHVCRGREFLAESRPGSSLRVPSSWRASSRARRRRPARRGTRPRVLGGGPAGRHASLPRAHLVAPLRGASAARSRIVSARLDKGRDDQREPQHVANCAGLTNTTTSFRTLRGASRPEGRRSSSRTRASTPSRSSARPDPSGTSFHPHGDLVVLGGSAVPSDDTVPRPRPRQRAIIERCAAIEPLPFAMPG